MNFKAKKSLGQNFLKNTDIVKKIVESADLRPDNLVLEIGPGKGILTEELAKYAGKIIAIEIDKNLATTLDSRFRENDKIEIINEDILKSDLSKILGSLLGSLASKYKVIANLPYYITSPIIRLFLEAKEPPEEMFLMVQKEVAERICEKPGKMSILSVSVQYYAKPEVLFYVGKENFDPVPEVDSAVIKITIDNEQRAENKKISKEFFRIVRAGFSAKRKTLVNNLASSLTLDKNEVANMLEEIGIKKSSRAQELSVEDWKKLANIL